VNPGSILRLFGSHWEQRPGQFMGEVGGAHRSRRLPGRMTPRSSMPTARSSSTRHAAMNGELDGPWRRLRPPDAYRPKPRRM
jgi:hypothetical protein